MDHCCEIRSDVPARQRRVLHVVLWINIVMFAIEFIGGLVAHSTSLMADSVDMLGDAIVYGVSLYAIGRGVRWQARAAMLKGVIMAAFAGGILVEVGLKLARDVTPAAGLMTGVGVVALLANASVLALLWRRREDDVNMRSAWLCSRNDVVANAGVLVAAGGVAWAGSAWPDILIGLAIAALFARSAAGVIADARRVLHPVG